MFSVSQDSVRIVKERILPFIDQLNCGLKVLKNGATVIDMGVETPGGWLAGKLFVEATIGGLGYVNYGRFQLGSIDLPSIDVYIDQPQVACLSSQFSSWPLPMKLEPGYIRPMGSGPARAIARIDYFSQLWDYTDIHHETVFGVQAEELPEEDLADEVAVACHISPKNLYILVCKTASLAGSVQICSRTIETTIWRLQAKGFDIRKVLSGMGSCPIAPPAKDPFKAMVRVNNAVLYGGSARYIVDATDDEIQAIIDQLPTNSTKLYGVPFSKIFKEANLDVTQIDQDIHAVAVFEIMNYNTGNVFRSGEFREEYLKEIFY